MLDILYNDDSGDDLIPELDSNSDSESDNEIPISPVARPIEKTQSYLLSFYSSIFRKSRSK